MKIRIVPASRENLEEKKKKGKDDRCTRIAKRKYDVWPSAYASGAVVKCRQGKIWKGISEGKEEKALEKAEDEVLDTLEDEGGAAGLEPLEKALSDNEGLPDDFDIEEFLADFSDEEVQKHDDGDYIEMGGLDEGEIVDFTPIGGKDQNLETIEALFDNFKQIQDTDDKDMIGAVLLLNIRGLNDEDRSSLDPEIDLEILEKDYGRIVDVLSDVLRKNVIDFKSKQ